MAERTFDDFDEYAKDYRTVHAKNIKVSGADSFYFAEMKVKLLKEFEKDRTLKILDVGCGDGVTEVFIKQQFPCWEVSAIDISEKSIEEAKAKNIDADFHEYNGINIPFDNNTFDIVFMAGVLHHVNFLLHNNLIKEVARVLKNDGNFYFFEHNPFNPLTKHLVNTCEFDKNAKLLKSNYATKLLAQNFFTITNKQFIIFLPRKGVLSKFIFLEKYLKWLPLGGQYFIVAKKN